MTSPHTLIAFIAARPHGASGAARRKSVKLVPAIVRRPDLHG